MTTALPVSVRVGEPLARHTAVRTGGPCDVFVVAHDVAGVAEVVADCRAVGWKLQLLGAGTRCVVRDGPIAGAVLRLGHTFARITPTWEVGAAVPMPALVQVAAARGARGLEDKVCVPGSFAASLLWDPGWDELVVAVQIFRRGGVVDVDLEEVRRKRPIVLGAKLVLAEDDPAEVVERTLRVWAKQEPVPAGAAYDPPRRTPVRTLLRGSRLTMVRLRGIAIPDLAPELLVNLGEGTAADLALLHKSAIERVLRIQGEQLTSRIRWLGRAEEEERWESEPDESASFSAG